MAILGAIDFNGIHSFFGVCECGQWFCNTQGWSQCAECTQKSAVTAPVRVRYRLSY